MQFWNGYPLIDDDTPDGEVMDITIDGQFMSRGLVPRDYTQYPETMFAPPSEMPLIAESEWEARIEMQEALRSSLEHIYLSQPGDNPAFINLDQNGDGYCWIYSTTHSVMLARLRDNQPLVRLNPHSGGAIIKNGRNEGGWCGLSAQFLRETGIAEEGTGPGQWPLHSRDLRHDTPACRAAMAKYRITEDWVDLSRRVYDQNLTFQQLASALLCNQPCPVDFNWWGHSVCAVRLIKVEAGSFGVLILNSWKGWGRHGLGVLRGSKMVPNGAVCTRVTRAA